MKLKNIKVTEVYHPNIFLHNTNEIEVIDVVMGIDYMIDEDTIDFDEYGITLEDLEDNFLEDIIPCYMIVPLEEDTYTRMDEVDYKNLEYLITSDVYSDVEKDEQEISDEEKLKTFNLIKEYLETDEFKDELKRSFEYEESRKKAIM